LTIDSILATEGSRYFPPTRSPANLRKPEVPKAEAERIGGLFYLNRLESVAVSAFYTGVVHMLPWVPKAHSLHGRSLEEAYRWLAAKYLHPVRTVREEADAFHARHIAGRPCVAVHVRGLDKGPEAGQVPELQLYFQTLDRLPSTFRIFLLTDDACAAHIFAERYGERLVHTAATRAEGDMGLHLRKAYDPSTLGREVMVDVYVALKCDRFLGLGWSNISSIIYMLKPWPRGTCGLWGPCILQHRIV